MVKICIVFFLCFVSSISYANSYEQEHCCKGRPQGFDTELTSVAKIQQYGKDDDFVHIKGRFTNYLGDDKYVFTDFTGLTIVVELDDDFNWSQFSKNELIEIFGELDKDFFSVKVKCNGGKALQKTKEEIELERVLSIKER